MNISETLLITTLSSLNRSERERESKRERKKKEKERERGGERERDLKRLPLYYFTIITKHFVM